MLVWNTTKLYSFRNIFTSNTIMKKLKEILLKVNIDSVYGDTNINVSKITFDSRDVKDHALFIAIKGHNFDGHDYINHATENGASVVVCENLPINFKKNR